MKIITLTEKRAGAVRSWDWEEGPSFLRKGGTGDEPRWSRLPLLRKQRAQAGRGGEEEGSRRMGGGAALRLHVSEWRVVVNPSLPLNLLPAVHHRASKSPPLRPPLSHPPFTHCVRSSGRRHRRESSRLVQRDNEEGYGEAAHVCGGGGLSEECCWEWKV